MKKKYGIIGVILPLLIILLTPSALASNIGVWYGNPLEDGIDRNQLYEHGTVTYTTSTWGGNTVDVFELAGSDSDWFTNLSLGTGDLDLHDTGGTWVVWIYPHDNTQTVVLSSGRWLSGDGEATTLRFTATGELSYVSHVGGDYSSTMTGNDVVPVNQWTMVALVINKTTWGAELWINTSLDSSNSGFNRNPPDSNRFSVGGYDDGTYGSIDSFDGMMFCPRVYNTSLDESELTALYNSGVPVCDAITPDFTAVVNNATDTTRQGDTINWSTVVTGGSELDHCWFSHNDSGTWVNESVVTCDSGYNYTELIVVTASTGEQVCGYFGANTTSITETSPLSCFTPHYRSYLNVTYSDFQLISGTSYTRKLFYNASIINCLINEPVQFNFYVNDIVERSESHSCVAGENVFFDHTYTHDTEEWFNASFDVVVTQGLDINRSDNVSFFSDLENPQISVTFSEPGGVFNNSFINVTYACWDSVFPQLNYSSVIFNGNSIFNDTGIANNTVLSNESAIINGENTFFMTCSDAFSETNLSDSFTGYSAIIFLWDEQENVVFDAGNLSYAKMWFGKNASFYDFTGAAEAKVNFSSLNDSKLRIELGYLNGDIIVRYIDLALFDQSSDVKVCANKDDGSITHYQQIVISASEKWVAMKNVFTDCYILADKTRFAEENAFMVQAFSMNSLYDLYTYDGSVQVLLASIDGSIQGYINLDVLEFNQEGFDFSVNSEALTFSKSAPTMMRIDYMDLRMDNTALTVILERLDTREVLLSRTEFESYDNFTLYFDWASLYNVTNSTLFEIQVVSTNTDGSQNIIKRFFNTSTSSGVLNSALAAILAFAMVFFGITIVASNSVFGWFGVVVMMGGLIVLQLAVSTWYITFLTGLIAVAATFIILVSMKKNVMGLFT